VSHTTAKRPITTLQ